jgi:oligopeptide/dipeptide ABC transporter ATP-binding protein
MTMPLLQVQDLCLWYPLKRGFLARTRGHVHAVDGVSLDIAPGETVGLVGESGCGKTTLGRTIIGMEQPQRGSLTLAGVPLQWHDATSLALRRRIQMVFQDPYSSLNPRLTVIEIVTEAMLYHGLITKGDRAAEATRLLREVGLDADALYRYPHEFSGGQRQRISIARALALRPELVICDEPVSALDVSVRAQVLNLLIALRQRHGLAYLFISHDLAVVRHIAQRTLVMYLGQLVETGPTDLVLGRPAHPYSRALMAAVPVPFGPRERRLVLQGDVPSPANPPAACRFHTRCPYAIEVCRQVVPPLEPFPDDPHRVACHRKHELPPFSRTGEASAVPTPV